MRDFDIRLALKGTTLLRFYKDSSVVVEELCLPCAGARIDIAVVNGSLHGFEIKSACDTLTRLPSQIDGYSKIFDYVTIVTEEKHFQKIEAIVPQWVGISYFRFESGRLSHKTIRRPKLNKNIDGFFVAKLLRKEELQLILLKFQLPFKKNMRAWTLCEILASNVSTRQLSEAVRHTLKSRTAWKLNSKAGLRSS